MVNKDYMKKSVLIYLGIFLSVNVLANSHKLYSQPDELSNVIGEITKDNNNFKPIFEKYGWLEVVDIKTGNVYWLKKKNQSINHIHDFITKQNAINKKFELDISRMNESINYLVSQSQISLQTNISINLK